MRKSQSTPGLNRSDGGEDSLGHREGSVAAPALYATPSYASLYGDVEDLEPGPGSYDMPSGLGLQHESMKDTIPQISLTAKHSKAWSKAWISKDHLQELLARDTPGPGTYMPEILQTQAGVRFGTSKRRGLNEGAGGKVEASPGPALYDIRGDIRTDCGRTRRFGRAGRWAQDAIEAAGMQQDTGPGQYESGTAFDGVRLSKSFGVSHRAYDKVRFPGADRLNYGRLSPGPGPFKEYEISGKEYSFSRATRPSMASAIRGPGPGQYDNHEKVPLDVRRKPAFGFGKPSAKGRLDWKVMRQHSNSQWGLF